MYMRIAAVVLLSFATCCAQNKAERPVAGSQRLGDYSIEPEALSKACAVDEHGGFGQLTQRIFYKDRLITEVAMAAFVSPLNPSRLVYSVAPACGTEDQTGTFYFHPSLRGPVQASIGITSQSPELLKSLWSADDEYLVVPANGMDLMLLNLETGKSINLSKAFYAHGTIISFVTFRGWSPDGKHFALAVESTTNTASGGMREQTDLVSVNPVTLQGRYVATMRKKDGWRSGEFLWAKDAEGFELAVHPELRQSLMIYFKPSANQTPQPK